MVEALAVLHRDYSASFPTRWNASAMILPISRSLLAETEAMLIMSFVLLMSTGLAKEASFSVTALARRSLHAAFEGHAVGARCEGFL